MLLQESLPFGDMGSLSSPALQKTSFQKTKNNREMARQAAAMFWKIGAVKFRPEQPYTFASGLVSPVYVDCRKIISYPKVRSALMKSAVSVLKERVGPKVFKGIAGGETAGIPFAALIAHQMKLPMQYVRKQPKGYGRDAQIEGDIIEGANVLLVEDLSTDGGSKLAFAKALRNAGAVCDHTLVLFYYDIFKDTPSQLKENGLELHYVLNWWDILDEACESGHFESKTLKQVEDFLYAPIEWSEEHGGNYKNSMQK